MKGVKLWVDKLDERMGSPIPEGFVVLIAGPSGSMKSTFTFNVLYKAAMNEGKKSLYISLEQSRNSLIRHMANVGMNIEAVKDKVTILDIGRLRGELGDEAVAALDAHGDWMSSIEKQLTSYKEMLNPEIVAIDSLDALYTLSTMHKARNRLFHFFRNLRGLGFTSFLISEMPEETRKFGKYDVERFLSDGIIHLALERTGRSVGRYIAIVKMREIKHPTDYFPMLIDRSGFAVVTR